MELMMTVMMIMDAFSDRECELVMITIKGFLRSHNNTKLSVCRFQLLFPDLFVRRLFTFICTLLNYYCTLLQSMQRLSMFC